MTDLDTLRPEVRAAMDEMDRIARIVPAQCSDELRIVLAELLRLVKIEKDYGFAIDCERRRADEAEAELAALKARIDGSRHAFLVPNMDRITFLAEDIGPVGKYALMKVEE